jgi:hypothetical protein
MWLDFALHLLFWFIEWMIHWHVFSFGETSLNSRLCVRKADDLLLEPYLHPILLWLFWWWNVVSYLGWPWTSVLPISASQVARIYRREPLAPGSLTCFKYLKLYKCMYSESLSPTQSSIFPFLFSSSHSLPPFLHPSTQGFVLAKHAANTLPFEPWP